MANGKIRSFADYDAAKAAREGQDEVEKMIDSELERIILNDITGSLRKQGAPLDIKLDVIRFFRNPGGLLRMLLSSQEEMLIRYAKERKKALRKEVEKSVYLKLFQENLSDLLKCSSYLAKQNRDGLNKEDRHESFMRFIDELESMSKNSSHQKKFCEISDLSYLVNRYHIPEDEEGLRKMRNVMNGLRKGGYISGDNRETLFRFLAPLIISPLVPAKAAMPLSEKKAAGETKGTEEAGRTEASRISSNQSGEVLEYLAMAGINEEKAAPYAEGMELNDLKEFYEGLETHLGDETAHEFFQGHFPALLPYVASGVYTKYLTTLSKLQQRLGENGGKKRKKRYGLKGHEEEYASLRRLGELKKKLFQETGDYDNEKKQDGEVNDDNANGSKDDYAYLFSYAIMRKNPVMEDRLSNLIEEGELIVGRDEHWMGNNLSGPRGKNILKVIRTELNYLFGDLSCRQLFGVPQNYDAVCEINFGQSKLMIDPWAQNVLRQVREERDRYFRNSET